MRTTSRSVLPSFTLAVLGLAVAGAPPSVVQAQAATGPAPSESTPGEGLEEVVVTAQRRVESLERAAVAITAVSGADISERGVTQLADLTQLVPSVQIDAGAGPYTSVSLRGVATTAINSFSDPAVAVNLDGIYLPRPTSPQGIFYDIERVEVLKGPQGTLYGRNATGGAINVITRAPQLGQTTVDATLDAGNYGLINGTGAVNVALGETAAARGAFQVVSRGGYFSDGTSDEVRQSGRISFLLRPSDALTATLHADYTHLGGHGTGGTAYCVDGLPVSGSNNPNTPGRACPPTGQFYGNPWTGISQQAPAIYPPVFPVWTTNSFIPTGVRPAIPLAGASFQDVGMYTIYGQLDWHLPAGTLTILPGYRHESVDYLSEAAGLEIREMSATHQESVEVRFASETTPERPLSYVAGLYFLDSGDTGTADFDAQGGTAPPPVLIFPPAPNVQLQHTDNTDRTGAVFGQATYAVLAGLRFTAGVRYTNEHKDTNSDDGAVPYFVPTRGAVPPPGGPFTGLTDANGYLISPAANSAIFFTTQGGRTWNAVNWKAGLEYDLGSQSLLYANVATGFKSGGFFFSPARGIQNFSYEPEKLTAYTLGSKNRFLDNRLQVNLEAFHWIYRDQQVAAVALIPPFIIFPQQNAKQASIDGAELDLRWLLPMRTLLSADVQYSRGKYDDFVLLSAFPATGCRVISPGPPIASDCSGTHMLNAPDWTIGAGLEHTFALPRGGNLVANVTTHFESTRLVGLSAYQSVPSNTRSNASLRYEADRWSLEAYVDNLENAVTAVGVGESVNFVPGLYATSLRPPRTYGARISLHY